MARIFVIRPFGVKANTAGVKIDFEVVQDELITPAMQASCHEFSGGTTGEIIEAGNIREDMFALILEADLVISDVTIHNANVFYELGIRHALRKRRTIMIKGSDGDTTPFDLSTDRYLPYDSKQPCAARDELTAMINATIASDRQTDSPIFQLLPRLPEVDLKRVSIVPADFREEVERARVGNSIGWLRLLAKEVRNERFQWGGLRCVGQAQWDLKDYAGASATWEAITALYPDDVEANLALANIYERQYTSTKKEECLARSNQAIERVKSNPAASAHDVGEALALDGRNLKTRWKTEFESADSVAARRAEAMSKSLRDAYEAYLQVFRRDLNKFWPGLVALQLGTILLDFSKDEHWPDAFPSDEKADDFRERLEKSVAGLLQVVPMATSAALQQIPQHDPNRYWAEISAADVLFLTSDRERRVVKAYEDAVPADKPFAWDAARGQLKLFSDLGVRTALADAVIAAMDDRYPASHERSTRPTHLIVFAGHRIDEPGRKEERFPPRHEARARELITAALQELIDDDTDYRCLASAAPGADILFHEICAELGLDSTICLPMPSANFARMAFGELDEWRNRYLALEHTGCTVLELSDRDGLPRWLRSQKPDPWERGNDWVYQMAAAQGANRRTLLAFWDGRAAGDARGGTAQMVRLARDSGEFRVNIVDSTQLL